MLRENVNMFHEYLLNKYIQIEHQIKVKFKFF
jgi:hypothetical protein